MSTRSRAIILPALLAWSIGGTSFARPIAWDESINGDISNDRNAPSSILLALGSNTLTATSVSGDREYIHMGVPFGMSLAAINHVSWTSTDQLGFVAIQPGAIFTEPPTGTNVANLMGYTHFGPGAGTVGADILPALGAGAGATGFTPPLPFGNYVFWIQQTGQASTTYELDFVMIPAPGSITLLSVLGLTIARRRR
jgi:hypothetical protein